MRLVPSSLRPQGLANSAALKAAGIDASTPECGP